MTRQEKFVVVLEGQGFTVVKKGKYIVMGKEGFETKGAKPAFFFLGRSGALRVGRNQASSRSLSDRYKGALLKKYVTAMPPGF